MEKQSQVWAKQGDGSRDILVKICKASLSHRIVTTIIFLFGPVSRKRLKLPCASIEDSDQPAHSHSLIRVFDWFSFCSQGSSVSTGEKL